MSNETDLDWLARNVHVWKSGYDLAVVQRGIEEIYVTWPSACSSGITKKEWLSRRAELQNKPSWEDAPEWGEWLAQDEDGEWKWLAGLPGKYVDGWTAVKIKGHCKGIALGDWRGTLEKRPEQKAFQPLTSIEDSQEQEMKQDNGWFERGELPPVGVECDIRHSCWNSEKYEKVTVAAITNEYLIVKYATFEQHYMLKDISFRPIRTERDVLLSVIVEEMNRYDTDGKLADAILAAGFSLRDK
ncbi:MAG: hypothetical protein ACRCXB_34785 [Aeromonadaceae bacterium]